jgi:hypothetical protein
MYIPRTNELFPSWYLSMRMTVLVPIADRSGELPARRHLAGEITQRQDIQHPREAFMFRLWWTHQRHAYFRELPVVDGENKRRTLLLRPPCPLPQPTSSPHCDHV